MKIKDSLDGGDQSKMWSEETNTLKRFRDIGGETGLPTMIYPNISGKSDPNSLKMPGNGHFVTCALLASGTRIKVFTNNLIQTDFN